MPYQCFSSPVGPLSVFEEEDAIVAIEWGRAPDPRKTPLLAEARRQLDAYFDGALQSFDLALAPRGTAHQKAVWNAMLRIPYGEVQTYGEIATEIGSAPRAVGGACGANPIPIIIPCHRVVGGGGRLTGYSGFGGLDTKRALLRLEDAPIPSLEGDRR
ncbi:MAG: methylated-DNA--[protein]-cysteine S-methyltransferase [Rhodospirillales bacterium]|jgi:methylated-DNA-[protein]-cysteine S-methyltransferase|nr:methylated-DNA--[protein]-cysteine S-methyltransferase [Rhodospirillales bacterium]